MERSTWPLSRVSETHFGNRDAALNHKCLLAVWKFVVHRNPKALLHQPKLVKEASRLVLTRNAREANIVSSLPVGYEGGAKGGW
jgi:hypothetical protein